MEFSSDEKFQFGHEGVGSGELTHLVLCCFVIKLFVLPLIITATTFSVQSLQEGGVCWCVCWRCAASNYCSFESIDWRLLNEVHRAWPSCWPSGKVSTLRAADLGSIPAFAVDLFPSDTSDSKTGTPGACHYKVSARTCWPSVSILWLREIKCLACRFCDSAAAHTIGCTDISLRYTCMGLATINNMESVLSQTVAMLIKS